MYADGLADGGCGPPFPADLAEQAVDALDSALNLAPERSRLLLAQLVERRLERRLQVADYGTRRQWFIGLVDACARQPAGIAALAAAVGQLEPDSPAAGVLRRLSDAAGEPAVTRAPAPAQPRPERFTDAEVSELASVFYQAHTARQLLAAAGLPAGRQPVWSVALTSREFWTEVDVLLAAGALADGRRRVLAAAARIFPANPVFTGW
ncbi:effector-associated domain EAD1-containing protein [Frankia sp. CiP3]|uniref:effector-associated domain 2-containing protein n=1 Tax=Frankia sp. CiP3 TaxID=2880971 RepID=UPI001EF6B5DF|nr:effector-associated domain EAD1-containing protein [Frankia sp. CiP3]